MSVYVKEMIGSSPTRDVAYVQEEYKARRAAIRQRLADFSVIKPDEWFYELCYCLCTPQSKAVHAHRVIEKLKDVDFENKAVDPTPILRDPEHYIRFHNTKARNLLEMRRHFVEIRRQMLSERDAKIARAWLVANVRGIGMKEASHFLRNIGARNIAIIDRHILKHLTRCGVIDDPRFPSSVKLYEEIESRWQQFAADIRIEMDELDLLFWSMETGEILK